MQMFVLVLNREEFLEPLLEALALSRHRHPLSLPRVV
jgi:hypothetical protein